MRPDLGYEALRYLIDEVVFIHDEARRIVFVSPSVENVLGYPVETFAALRTIDLIHPDDLPDAFRTAVELRGREGATYRSTLRLRKQDGRYLWCEIVGRNLLHTEVGGVINTIRDVSEQRALQERLHAQAFVDDLTGLANRRAFTGALEEALKQDPDPALAVLIVDLDGFKEVNDRFGHQAGDARLRECAETLEGACRGQDLAARLGGDEFAVLCRDVAHRDDLAERAEAIRSAAERAGATTFSIGAALAGVGDAPAQLLRDADRALYEAKREGRNRAVLAARAGR